MCGIAGYCQPSGFAAAAGEEIVNGMSAELSHRGPDDAGTWLDGDAGIALGHRRLSILDLSSAGHQPMLSASGRYAIVFNGEIYNHLQIRKELERLESPPVWRGQLVPKKYVPEPGLNLEPIGRGFLLCSMKSVLPRQNCL